MGADVHDEPSVGTMPVGTIGNSSTTHHNILALVVLSFRDMKMSVPGHISLLFWLTQLMG